MASLGPKTVHDKITVYLGVTSVEEKKHSTSHDVSRIIIHPGWNKTLSFDHSGNDLALLELKTPITEWSEKIQPVCLPDLDNLEVYDRLVRPKKTVEVFGLGVTRSSDYKGADLIQHTKLKLLSKDQCENKTSITGDQHCALGDNSNICAGDSGSGLVVQEDGGSYTLIGVASTSAKRCGVKGNLSLSMTHAQFQLYIEYFNITKPMIMDE